MKVIILLGSTGHIGKSVLFFLKDKYTVLTPDRMSGVRLEHYFQELIKTSVDAIINCIGNGNPDHVLDNIDINSYNEIDNIIIDYITVHSKCKYINMSSWIVDKIVKDYDFKYSYYVNKLYLEMKHRLTPFSIVDLRIPAYFSRWQNLAYNYLMSVILNHIKYNVPLNINYDKYLWYLTPIDLISLIESVISVNTHINIYIDIYKYITCTRTNAILDSLGLNIYSSSNNKHYIGLEDSSNNYGTDYDWIPKFTSLEGIKYEYKEWRLLNGIV